MKHYPAARYQIPLAGVSHTHTRRAWSRTTIALAIACAFAAGFTTAVYVVGFILTRGP